MLAWGGGIELKYPPKEEVVSDEKYYVRKKCIYESVIYARIEKHIKQL